MVSLFKTVKRNFEDLRRDSSESEEFLEKDLAQVAATLLLEVAWADHNIEPKEISLIRESLTSLYDLDTEEVDDVIEAAREHHEKSVDIHSLTSTLNKAINLEQKYQLLVSLWKLNEFDGSEFHYEESIIRRIASLLYLSHSDFIRAKLQVKQATTD